MMRELFRRNARILLALFLSLSLVSEGYVYAAQKPRLELEGFTISVSDTPIAAADRDPKLPQGPEISGSAHMLSLKDTIDLAVKNNKDIQIQQKEVDFARANIVAAQSKFMPALSMGYSYTIYDAVLPLNSLSTAGSGKDPGLYLGYKNDNQINFNGSQMIYDGGASIASLKQARVNLKIQEETLRSRILQIEFEAKRLYYGLLLAYETLRITKYLLDQAQAHYENVKAKFEQGTASRFDVLQSKVQVSLMVPQYVNAQKSEELIAADIKKLLYINLQDKLAATERLSYMPIEIWETAFLGEAYAHSPQMRLRMLGVDLKKWAIEEAKSGWYPNINTGMNYIYRSDSLSNMFNTRHNNVSFALTGTVPIFDGMSTLAKVKEAKARYSQEILGKENIIEQIARDIKQGCLDLKEAHAIILAQKDNLQEAKEALRISYISYDNGVGINLDVIDSMTSLGQVEKNLVSGIYDYLVAQAYLDRTMGREYFENNSGGSR